MKRFNWRLQRLLDIRIKQQDAIRAELLAVTEKLIQAQQELLMRQTILRETLMTVARKAPKQRLPEQELVLKSSRMAEEQIKKLKHRVNELESQRKAKLNELMKVRRFRKGLEKLRENAKREFVREQERVEQKQIDESAQISFARKILGQADFAETR